MKYKKELVKIFQEIENAPDITQNYIDAFTIIRCEDGEHLYSGQLRRYIAKALSMTMNVTDSDILYNLLKNVLLFDAPVNFDAYLQYVEWDREPERKFYIPRRKVLKPVVDAMQELTDDKLDLLAISMPPGVGKSTLGIFYLTWIMGRYPDSPNLASAHSGTLTRSFYDGVSQIITDPEYLWQDVFPNTSLFATNSKEETLDLNKKHRFSSLTCRAINASLTGATRCEKLLYADDLCSGIEEALSKERLNNLWTKYTNDLKSRKKQKCKEIHIATRWSIYDVIGRLQSKNENNPRAKFIVLPALNEKGESNFKYDYDVGFDTAYFEDMKDNLDNASFRALYQNEPVEREGQLYAPDELRRFFLLPDGEPDAILSICDTKDRGTDYAFMPICAVYGNDHYVITIGTTDVPALVDEAERSMNENEVPVEGRILFISENAYAGLRAKITRSVQNDVLGVNREIETYDGMPVVRVPQNRFYSAITLYDGTTTGQTGGGYIGTATTGYKINFMVIHPSAVCKVVKHALPRIFTPEQYQQADAWKFDYRVYHDCFAYDNKVKGIYLHRGSTALS